MSQDDPLRPSCWEDYVGQEALKERLLIHIESAITRVARLDHILLIGPPGCGKTSLARVVAETAGSHFMSLKCPVEQKVLTQTVRTFRGVLFLDEIHLMPKGQQHDLLLLIEDGYLQLPSGQKIDTDNLLTVISATTEPDKIIAPLLERYPVQPSFDEYTDEEMATIVRQMGLRGCIEIPDDMALALGRAAGGTPRAAGSLVVMTRDLSIRMGTMPTVEQVLDSCRISSTGLTENHMRYLKVLADMGGVAGIEPIANHLRLPKSILMNLERLMVKQTLITYTKQGRELTSAGYAVVNPAPNPKGTK
jgi:Holliday junction DNA helicase RuvB